MKMPALRGTWLAIFLLSFSVRARAADPTTCRDQLENIGSAFTTDTAKAELEKADCDQRTVLCVDATGYPIASEGTNPGLKSGDVLIVKLFGPKTCEGVLTVRTDLAQSDVTLFAPSPPPLRELALPAVVIEQLAKATATTDARTETITVSISRTDASKLSVEGVTLPVTPPRYYLDVGLLVAFTPQYQRVSTQRSPGSREAFIRETNTVRAAGAITVNYFPAGQYAVPRFAGYHGLGIQAGMGANFDRIDDEFYLGLIWEPIPGAGVSAGLALLEMQRLQPHYPSGALVEPGDVPTDSFLGPRFYFGVSLNTQVFQTVLSLGSNIHVPN